LALLRDKVLNSLFDRLTLELHERLSGIAVSEHRALNQIVGLLFPYEEERSIPTPVVVSPDEAGTAPYVSPNLMAVVDEPVSTVDLRTLQFNSLLIRRPDAEERLRRTAQTFALQSMEHSSLQPSTLDES
jgi:hypothetical protein